MFYLLQDHLKSSSAFVTQNGTVASRNYYFSFGGNRGGTAFSGLTMKRFTGQYHEASLPGDEGLSYYGARWYDAKLGRFLSADTIVPGPANPQAFNRYSYVFNNPTRYIDPSGRCPFCIIVAVGAALMLNSSASNSGQAIIEIHRMQILQVARRRNVDPVILGAIIDHESGSIKRFGGVGDWGSITVKPNASIGLGQVQPSLAKQIEDAGYMPKLPSVQARIDALMDERTNIEYTAARLQQLRGEITRWYGKQGVALDGETRNRLMMLAYNQGWDDPNNPADVLDNLVTYKERYGIERVTNSIAYYGTLPEGEPINNYHISEMWNPARIRWVESVLRVQYGGN